MPETPADRLIAMRKFMRHTQDQFAAIIGVSKRSLQGYEAGRSLPSSEALLRLSDLGYSPLWILTGQGGMRLEEHSQAGGLRAGEALTPAADVASSVETAVLQQAIELVDDWLAANGRVMTAAKKADVVAKIYQFAIEDVTSGQPPIDSRRVGQFLRLVG